MTDDQVLGNVMLSQSTSNLISSFRFDRSFHRHQLLGLAAQKKLAERKVLAHQEHDGQAHPDILDGEQDMGGMGVRVGVSSKRRTIMHKHRPRTLGPTAFRWEADWELIWCQVPGSFHSTSLFFPMYLSSMFSFVTYMHIRIPWRSNTLISNTVVPKITHVSQAPQDRFPRATSVCKEWSYRMSSVADILT